MHREAAGVVGELDESASFFDGAQVLAAAAQNRVRRDRRVARSFELRDTLVPVAVRVDVVERLEVSGGSDVYAVVARRRIAAARLGALLVGREIALEDRRHEARPCPQHHVVVVFELRERLEQQLQKRVARPAHHY